MDHEEPVPDLSSLDPPHAHVLVDGSHHPIEVGMSLVEAAGLRMRSEIAIDPLRPVAHVYEQVYDKFKNGLNRVEKEEFI